METLDLLILLPVFASAYLTSLLCRFARRRQRSVRWYFGLVGAIATGGLTALFIALGLSIQAGQTPYAGFFYIFALEWLPISALPPALLVVWYYRRKSRRKP
jgi:ABC-type Co2+ transport system permease subunit